MQFIYSTNIKPAVHLRTVQVEHMSANGFFFATLKHKAKIH